MRPSIDPITNYRTAQKSQMEANLVCATSDGVDFQRTMSGESLQGMILGEGEASLSRGDHSHFLPLRRVTPNCRFDPPVGRWRSPIDQRQVHFLHLAGAELILKPVVGGIVLGKQDQPRSILI